MILDREKLYSPEEILELSQNYRRGDLPSKDAQQLYEANIIAMLLSLTEKINNDQKKKKIKLTDHRDQIPDVIVAYLDSKGSEIESVEYEVVSFTPYSKKEGLLDFFKRTKLSPVYAYPQGTQLVCYIDMPIKAPQKMCKRMSAVLKGMDDDIELPIYILCSQKQTSEKYAASIYPDFVELASNK